MAGKRMAGQLLEYGLYANLLCSIVRLDGYVLEIGCFGVILFEVYKNTGNMYEEGRHIA